MIRKLLFTLILPAALACNSSPMEFQEEGSADEASAGMPADILLEQVSQKELFEFLMKNNKSLAKESLASEIGPKDLKKALRTSSLALLGREPLPEEILEASKGIKAYSQVIDEYMKSDEFLEKMRQFFQKVFEMSGTVDGVNYDEPANFAVYLIKNNIDFREILKADYCIDLQGNKIPCSSFGDAATSAEQAAGVVTTRAFMKKWASAFNFRRVSKMFQVFTCKEYPDEDDRGVPKEAISTKVKDFACQDCVPACISCHKSMNPRASLFYAYDREGMFNLNPGNQGTQTDTGQTSTIEDLLNPGSEPTYHGQKLTKLRDYAHFLADNKKFRNCMAQRFVNHMIGSEASASLRGEFQDIRDEFSWNGFLVKDMIKSIATHPAFIKR